MARRRSARSLFFLARALLIFLSKACASLHGWNLDGHKVKAVCPLQRVQ